MAAMITAFLLKHLGAMGIRWLIMGGIGAVGLGGWGATTWWLQWLDTPSYWVFFIAGFFCLYLMVTNNPWAKVLIPAVLFATGYIKGGIDKKASMIEEHRQAIEFIHQTYKDEGEAEKRRQAEEAAKATKDGDKLTSDLISERDTLRARVKELTGESSNDQNASRPAFSVDAVRRLNRLRHPRAGAAVRAPSG